MRGYTFFLVMLWLCCCVVPVAGQERNVVLFVADDLSPTLGCYGDKVARTPHLDAFAKTAERFNQAYATTASCSASRSVILTGLHNHATGQYGHAHAFHKFNAFDNVVSLPNALNAGGYRTACCGKYHVAPREVFQFQSFISGNSRNTVEMANRCREFLSSDSDQPFFLYFATVDPHRGGGTAEELPHAPDRFGNPKPGQSYAGVEEATFDPAEIQVPDFLPDTPATRAELAQYYQAVSRVDQGFGRLVNILKESGKWDTTLVIFISDHGMAFAGAKTTVYEPGLRSPCIVRNPLLPNAESESDALVSWTDITPTILDFAGLLDEGKLDESVAGDVGRAQVTGQRNNRLKATGFHGRSIFNRGDSQNRDTVYASHTFHEITMYYPMRVVREHRYKLIWNVAHQLPFPFATDLWSSKTWQTQFQKGLDAAYGTRTVDQYIHRPRFELYDLENDPQESRNLIDDPAMAEIAKRLKTKLKTFQKRTADPWVSKWDYE